jgi:hypothetical protein
MSEIPIGVIAIGSTDIPFALDSIPAVFGVTDEAFIVFAAAVLLLTTVASVIKARRDPTARAHAGSLRAHPEPYRAASRDDHGQHHHRAPAYTPKPQ